MLKSLTLIVAAVMLAPAASFAAAPCRDAHGHFMRCPAATPTPAPAHPNRCRLHGRFTSCSTPGATHG